ncbi:hypothetical protein FTX61_00020 [Nitriliruptoraceae bacterium ZYF776]|nr:hypothetical protein [Profundirhabdus halotolerans]
MSDGPQQRPADDRRASGEAPPPDATARARGREPSPAAVEPTSTVPFTQKLGRVALVVIAVLFITFALGNAQFVDFSWIFGETEVVRQAGERIGGGVPLIVLLVVAFVAGAAVGSLGSRQRRRHRAAAKRDRG